MTDTRTEGAGVPAWDEPRGPHLPDLLTRIALPVWPFVALAVVLAYRQWDMADRTGFESLGELLVNALQGSSVVMAPLIGAALFLRHPRAHRTMPMLAAGVILLAGDQLLGLIDAQVSDALISVDRETWERELATPLTFAYNSLRLLVPVLAFLLIGRGLDLARRVAADTSLLVVLGLLLLAAAPFVISTLGFNQSNNAQPIQGLVFSSLDGLVTPLALAYLAITVIRGYRAREEPVAGWMLAAVGMIAFLAVRLAYELLGLATRASGQETSASILDLYRVVSLVGVAGWLLLVAAFAVGLPAEGEGAAGSTEPRPGTAG